MAVLGTSESMLDAQQMDYVTTSMKEFWAGNQSLFVRPGIAEVLRAIAEVGATVTRDMDTLGVGILVGCDALVPGFCVHDELEAMVRGGMAPASALRAATLNPARYFGLEDTLGSVRAGRKADLVLLEGNPLTDIANTRRIRAVVTGGRFLDRAELDGLLEAIRITISQE
jgi:imidazolonepropionase-like amidohydrolase